MQGITTRELIPGIATVLRNEDRIENTPPKGEWSRKLRDIAHLVPKKIRATHEKKPAMALRRGSQTTVRVIPTAEAMEIQECACNNKTLVVLGGVELEIRVGYMGIGGAADPAGR